MNIYICIYIYIISTNIIIQMDKHNKESTLQEINIRTKESKNNLNNDFQGFLSLIYLLIGSLFIFLLIFVFLLRDILLLL